ncbi:hypothetical protein [Halosimplex pelagicum]|uniref:Uncharacterized protein n=1 Tax=Halosimplex pelagicum TaxID=869886 RepID=A0A7D5PFA7_9EURY|nr:hypothetical protein [Halosimplex pelagicum]QLH82463.1 hypothetical protein HZS54_12935 [Halosimplex pelagicum]QLH82519.1 hypothetical protein HZS54_13240 [Halosimplex pelagicum]
MAELSLMVEGIEETIEELERLEERWTGGGPWVVGTAVEYAVYLEFGTSKMDPKPFVRPAIHAYRSNLQAAIAADTNTTLDAIGSAEELVQTIAYGLERRIKRIITAKGLIETGTLRASVQAVPGDDVDQLPTADEVNPEASADLEVSA